jgi:hypothetical protein
MGKKRCRLENTTKTEAAATAATQSQLVDHPFETDFGDHFATEDAALRHVVPVLRWLDAQRPQQQRQQQQQQSVIYDPFFCDGSIKVRLHALGFRRVVHENRDFYSDVREKSVPQHDILLTNPPYSGDHKARVLEFLLTANERRPWALLVPAYCVTKGWYQSLIRDYLTPASEPFFIVPSTTYEYEHPTGKGHATSPFESCWIVSAWDRTEELFAWCRERLVNDEDASVVRRATDLGTQNVRGVVFKRRPNPKARKKARMKMASSSQSVGVTTSQQQQQQEQEQEQEQPPAQKKQKKKKKRF